MAEIAGAVGGLLTCFCTPNCINTPVVERCKIVINPTKRIKELLRLKGDIVAHKEDVLSTLCRAEVEEGKTRSHVVTNWLKDVDQFLDETNVIEEKVNKTRRGIDRLLPYCCARSTMGTNISRLLREATELLQRVGGLSGEILTIPEERRGIEFPVGRIIGETTAHKSMEMIWECLMNNEIRIIGVYGMGGVGKTTIVTKINNQLLEEKLLFDSVIWVTVSKSTSIHQIQVNVARAFNLSPPNTEDEREVSASLLRALKQKEKVVLILDDMWEGVSLHEIGIPEPTEENGWKVIVTTRSLEVCRYMGCRKESTIKLEPLSKKEAWELFIDRIGVELSEEVQKIAKNVVEECACLPLAIITVSGAMRGTEGISEWRVALNDLRYFREQLFNMETNVFKCLKFSYDRLPGENFKKCFLYCALFPEDWAIIAEELIDYWIMGGLIEGKDSEDETDQGQSILNKLINHCLLENDVRWPFSQTYIGVKMHDLIRDMALQFTSLLPSIVKAGVLLKELPKEPEWRGDLESASFMHNEIEEISISPRCPKLSILLLCYNRMLHSIPYGFFVHMQGLRVLDLSDNKKIEVLPDSISALVNLHALNLRNCTELKTLPSLSKLQLLRILNLQFNDNLESLPDSISDLTNLLVLRLSHCRKLMWVPPVARLSSLRTLELDYTGIRELPQGMKMLVNLVSLNLKKTKLSFKEITSSELLSALSSLQFLWLELVEPGTSYTMGSCRGLVEDLLSLKHLESLAITFPSLSDWANFVGSPNYKGLKKFCISIGDSRVMEHVFNFEKSFIVCGPIDVPYSAIFLPHDTRHFYIEEFQDIRSLSDLRCLKYATQLRECTIDRCEKLEYIKQEEDDDVYTLLKSVEVLKIVNCPKLHSVYKGTLSSVYCLRVLRIFECDNLKNVFLSLRLLQQLQNLEVIDIRRCHQLEEIIKAEDGEDTNIITLSKLWSLHVSELPKLKNIWKGEMVCVSLKSLEVKNCPELKRIPTFSGENQLPLPFLYKIRGNSEWLDSLEWDRPLTRQISFPYETPRIW